MSRHARHRPPDLDASPPAFRSTSSLILLGLTVAFATGIAARGAGGVTPAIVTSVIAGLLIGILAARPRRTDARRRGRLLQPALLTLALLVAGVATRALADAADPGARLLAPGNGGVRAATIAGPPRRDHRRPRADRGRSGGDRGARRPRASGGRRLGTSGAPCRLRLTLGWPDQDALPWRPRDR